MEAAPKYTEWTLARTRPMWARPAPGDRFGDRQQRAHPDAVHGRDRHRGGTYLPGECLRNAYLNTPGVEVCEWDVDAAAARRTCPCRIRSCVPTCWSISRMIGLLWQTPTKALGPGGRMIFIVPRGQKLYCSLDEAIGHYRRYDRDQLRTLFEDLNYDVEELFTLNKIGVLGWWWRGKIAKQKAIGRLGLKAFNVMVPLFRLIDPILPWKGLSLVIVARKPEE